MASSYCCVVKPGMLARLTPLTTNVTNTVGSSCRVALMDTAPGILLRVAVFEAAPAPDVTLMAAPSVEPGVIVQLIITPPTETPLFLAFTTTGTGRGEPGVAF